MNNVAIIYFSEYGYTEKIAQYIKIGVNQISDLFAEIIDVREIKTNQSFEKYDGLVFGAPTYMGSVPYKFKKFMDSTSNIWFKKNWKNKVAAGFTNSGSINGDNLNVLIQLCTFACQHGMVWISLGIDGSCDKENDNSKILNRMGSSIGLISQSNNLPPGEGDIKTAELFGRRIGNYVKKLFPKV